MKFMINNLSEELYMLELNAKLRKSEDDIRNGNVMTVEESKERLKKEYEKIDV